MNDIKTTSSVRKIPRPADYLQGESPRARGDKKQRQVIEWVYRWGYSSAEILRRVSGQAAQGYAKKLTEKGFLTATKTLSGIPRAYYTLSQPGLEEATRFAKMLLAYEETNAHKVSQQLIRHSLEAQTATVNAIDASLISEYSTERMMGAKRRVDEKFPDVMWVMNDGSKTAIEIELSQKWSRKLDQFILGLVRSLQGTSEKPPRFDRYFIFSDSPALIENYRLAMNTSNKQNYWVKNERNHWVIDKTKDRNIPEWLLEKVSFHLIEK